MLERSRKTMRHFTEATGATDPVRSALEALRDQRDACRALRECAMRQAALIEQGDGEGLLAVLAERQELIGRILNLAASPVDGETDHPEQCVIRTEIGQLVADVVAIDGRDQDLLRNRLEALGAERDVTAAAQVARRAYGPSRGATSAPVAPRPRYMDQQG